MKRGLAITLAMLILLVAFTAACGGGGGGGGGPAPGSAAPPAAGTSPDGSAPPSGGADPGGAPAGNPFEGLPTFRFVLSQADSDQSLPGQYMHAWAQMVHEKSHGHIVVDVNNGGGIAAHPQALGMLLDGTIDMTWVIHSPYPDVFPMSEVFFLPTIDLGTSEQATRTFVDVFENTDLFDDEYANVKVIALRTTTSGIFFTRDQSIDSMSDLNGLIIRSAVNSVTRALSQIGVRGEGVPIAELYSVLQNGSFDGAITDYHGIHFSRLYEVANYFYDHPIQYVTYMFVMNLDAYNSLPPELQQVIDDLSGQAAIDVMPDDWDRLSAVVHGEIRDSGGDIYTFPPDVWAQFQAAAEVATAEWIADQESRGRPAQRVYDTVLESNRKFR